MLRRRRHLGGFPLLLTFYTKVGAAGIHQQLSPDWRGSTPSSSFSRSSSPPTSLLETTHTHTVLHVCLPLLDALLPIMTFCFLSFPSAVTDPSLLLTRRAKPSLWLKACCVHITFSGSTYANYNNSDCDRQIMTFTGCVFWYFGKAKTNRSIVLLFRASLDFCLCEKTSYFNIYWSHKGKFKNVAQML